MFSTRPERDQILLVIDELALPGVDLLLVPDVILDATPFIAGGLIEGHEFLRRMKNLSWGRSVDDAADHSRICTHHIRDILL